MNPLDRIRSRKALEAAFEAKRERRRVARSGRVNVLHMDWLDKTIAAIWSETGDVGEAERQTRATLQQRANEVGFDPATILMLIQLAILIYKALKQLNVLNPTKEVVQVFFADDMPDLAGQASDE
jgi:hypothetical protein